MSAHGVHDPYLVGLSILIAVAASYAALDLAERTRANAGSAGHVWLAAAALAMGGGIWSMHFVAMLAFSLHGMEITYALDLTAVSALLAIGATAVGLLVVRARGFRPAPLLVSGVLMGTGIVLMHYTGMAAMRMQAALSHDWAWVVASVLIAVGASTAALWLAFRQKNVVTKLAAPIVMGAAISGMHYAGMRGARFVPTAHDHLGIADGGLGHPGLALGVAGATLLILLFALGAAMFDRRFADLARREAETLRRSEAAFRELYRRTPLPLHAEDGSGKIVEVSDAWLDLLGYRREEVLGRRLEEFAAAEAEHGGSALPSFHDVSSGGEIRGVEARLRTRAGAVLDVLVSARAEENVDGGFRRALFGLVDVTARRRAEEALRQAQKMEALGQITGGVAHDFNNVLAVVVGNLDRLTKRLAKDGESLRLAEHALEGAKRGIAVTERMLAFARRQTLRPEAFTLGKLLESFDDLLGQSLGPGVTVDKRIEPQLPAVRADADQLAVALLNLVINGRDAMPSGGTITLSARAVEVREDDGHGLKPGSYVCVAVRDQGEGMDAETLARARDPFFTTKPVGKGTGLGLSMVHGFAEQSGGALRLHSRKGEGSAAEIWLPAHLEPVTPPAPVEAKPTAAPARGPLRVLAVDDDALVLMNTAAMLEDLGCAVLEASSGPEALSLLAGGEAVDLVLTDQGMPGMTGLQLKARIRQLGGDVPVLIVTGYATLPEAEDHVRLQKPYGMKELDAAIDRCLTAAANVGSSAA